MANNRIYLTCSVCGEQICIGKSFCEGAYYKNYSDTRLEDRLNDFYEKHAHFESAESCNVLGTNFYIEHLSDYEWSVIKEYKTEGEILLEMPVIEKDTRQLPKNFFDKLFFDIQDIYRLNVQPAVLKDMLKPFEINNINPSISFDATRLMLTGHNKDVSIKALGMGCK